MTPSHPTQMEQQSGRSSEHTRGPWRVKESDNIFGELRALQIVKGRREIAEVMLIDRPASQVANARLIAAAPDLLAALRALLDISREEFSDPVPEFALAEAAIAKATGACT